MVDPRLHTLIASSISRHELFDNIWLLKCEEIHHCRTWFILFVSLIFLLNFASTWTQMLLNVLMFFWLIPSRVKHTREIEWSLLRTAKPHHNKNEKMLFKPILPKYIGDDWACIYKHRKQMNSFNFLTVFTYFILVEQFQISFVCAIS